MRLLVSTSAVLCVGNTLLLDGSRSREPDFGDAIAAYAWDLDGDGEHDDAEGRTPLPVAWATVRTLVCGGVCLTDHDYPLSLRVTDLRGDHGTDTATVI